MHRLSLINDQAQVRLERLNGSRTTHGRPTVGRNRLLDELDERIEIDDLASAHATGRSSDHSGVVAIARQHVATRGKGWGAADAAADLRQTCVGHGHATWRLIVTRYARS